MLLPTLHEAIHDAQRNRPGTGAILSRLIRRGGAVVTTEPASCYEGCPIGETVYVSLPNRWGLRHGDFVVAEASANACNGENHDLRIRRALTITPEEETLLGEW